MSRSFRFSSLWRQFRASWRDTVVLLREFFWPLLFFACLMIGSGLLYHNLAQMAGEPIASRTESIYLMLSATFLQSSGNFPSTWYLQWFYFIMPVLGVAILAQGLADFGVLLFNRRARGKEWEMAVASTFSNHTILVGLGHLGYRVAKSLCEMDKEVVAIELNPREDLVNSVRKLGVVVLEDDGTREAALEAAGIRRARSIVLCTQNDSINLQMALKARSLNPTIEVVVRIFDDDFAASLHKQFGFQAVSATGMAAPVFAALAVGIDITPPINIEGQANSLARILIPSNSPISGVSLGEIEAQYNLSVVLLCRGGLTDHHPDPSQQVQPADTIAVLGLPDMINELIHATG